MSSEVSAANLNLATTEELVTELQKRFNFRGVIIWQPGYNGVPDPGWRWHSMHCVASSVCSEIVQSLAPPSDVTITVEPGGEPTAPAESQPEAA